MSAYMFAPSPDLATKETNYMTWENGFSENQISSIIQLGESREMSPATVYGDTDKNIVDHIRRSEVSWIANDQSSSWLYDSMAYICRMVNGQFFGFDLYGFVEDFQYTVYRPNGGHYTWHIDKGMINHVPRKLSIVVQLSDPTEYEGGDLEFYVQNEPIKADKKKGLVYIFPSWVLHRVTPVTRGTRRSLVVWVAGPKFR